MSNRRYKIRKGCWAKSDKCFGALEKEHVVSDSILKYFGPLTFNNNGKKLNLGTGSYVIKDLCAYHNRMLSEFDNEAFRFFSGIDRMSKGVDHSDINNNEIGQNILKINGRFLEKWFAKTFFNSLIFESRAFNAENLPWFPSPHAILEKLFSDDDFESPYRLYMGNPSSPIFKNRRAWQMTPYYEKVEHYHKDLSQWHQYKLPIFYYTTCLGIELFGFFKATSHPYISFDDTVYNRYVELLNERCVYRPEKFGFSKVGQSNFGPSGPACIVELSW